MSTITARPLVVTEGSSPVTVHIPDRAFTEAVTQVLPVVGPGLHRRALTDAGVTLHLPPRRPRLYEA